MASSDKTAPVRVSIEYCDGWGYEPRYRELAQNILSAVPDALVDGFVGRSTSFEVKVNDFEVHSKLKTMAFPKFDEVVSIVQDVQEGQEPTRVTKTESTCQIL